MAVGFRDVGMGGASCRKGQRSETKKLSSRWEIYLGLESHISPDSTWHVRVWQDFLRCSLPSRA